MSSLHACLIVPALMRFFESIVFDVMLVFKGFNTKSN